MLDEPRRRTFTDDKVETHEDEVLVVREPLSACDCKKVAEALSRNRKRNSRIRGR